MTSPYGSGLPARGAGRRNGGRRGFHRHGMLCSVWAADRTQREGISGRTADPRGCRGLSVTNSALLDGVSPARSWPVTPHRGLASRCLPHLRCVSRFKTLISDSAMQIQSHMRPPGDGRRRLFAALARPGSVKVVTVDCGSGLSVRRPTRLPDPKPTRPPACERRIHWHRSGRPGNGPVLSAAFSSELSVAFSSELSAAFSSELSVALPSLVRDRLPRRNGSFFCQGLSLLAEWLAKLSAPHLLSSWQEPLLNVQCIVSESQEGCSARLCRQLC